MNQIEIDFEAGLTKLYPEIMGVIRAAAYGCSKPLKTVAADMDLSQSELSRKLADNPNDPRNLNADELPGFIEATGDKGKDVIYWLIERFLEDPKLRKDRAKEMLLEMAPMFMALMKEAMPETEAAPAPRAGDKFDKPSLRTVD